MKHLATAWKAGFASIAGRCRSCRAPPRSCSCRYGLDTDFDQIIGPVDISFVTDPDNFINHSCDPNLRYDTAGNVVAARDIRKGEEVFIDYGCFIVNFDEPFNCTCGARELPRPYPAAGLEEARRHLRHEHAAVPPQPHRDPEERTTG